MFNRLKSQSVRLGLSAGQCHIKQNTARRKRPLATSLPRLGALGATYNLPQTIGTKRGRRPPIHLTKERQGYKVQVEKGKWSKSNGQHAFRSVGHGMCTSVSTCPGLLACPWHAPEVTQCEDHIMCLQLSEIADTDSTMTKLEDSLGQPRVRV
jgi:hypothetical protein